MAELTRIGGGDSTKTPTGWLRRGLVDHESSDWHGYGAAWSMTV